MPDYLRDNKGRMIGSVRNEGNRKIYSDEKGQLVAFVRKESNGREITTAANGQFVGFRDQALRLFK